MTQYEYIYVDSKHALDHETDSEMTVNLSNPIMNARSVKLISFSSPNEYHNVTDNNNSIVLWAYPLNGTLPPVSERYTIKNGLHSIAEIVDLLNIEFIKKPLSSASTQEMTLLANNRVKLQVSHSTNPPKKMVMYYPPYQSFQQSLSYRLGFSRKQVCRYDNVDLIYKIPAGEPNENTIVYNIKGEQLTEAQFLERKPFEVWTMNSPLAINNTKTGNNIGFESPCSHLFVKSDLVKDFHQTFKDSDSGQTMTTQSSILQKIDVSVNIFSYIHYRSGLNEAITHSLPGTPISHFNISITNDHSQKYKVNEFKQFSCILMFEISEPVATQNLNERTIQHNQELQFKSRHNC